MIQLSEYTKNIENKRNYNLMHWEIHRELFLIIKGIK